MTHQKKSNDIAHGIYCHAINFLGSTRLLAKQMEKGWMGFSFPMAVMGAFSAELFLKCIHSVDTGNPAPQTHDLVKLFDGLKTDSRNEIQAAYDVMTTNARHHPNDPGPRDLRGSLVASKDAFVLFRYLYEGKGKRGDGYYLQSILDAMQIVIETRHPEWKR